MRITRRRNKSFRLSLANYGNYRDIKLEAKIFMTLLLNHNQSIHVKVSKEIINKYVCILQCNRFIKYTANILIKSTLNS